MFYRGYLESFSTVLKSPRTPVNNIIIKTENTDENIESPSSKLNDSNDVNKNIPQAKELNAEPIKKVLYKIELLMTIRFKLVI